MTRSSSCRRQDSRSWRDVVAMQKHAHWYVDLLMNHLTEAKLAALEEVERVARANHHHQSGSSPSSSSQSSFSCSSSQSSSQSSPDGYHSFLPTLGEGNLFLEHLALDPRPLDNVFPLQPRPLQLQQNSSSSSSTSTSSQTACRELAEQMRTMVRKGREMEEAEEKRKLQQQQQQQQQQQLMLLKKEEEDDELMMEGQCGDLVIDLEKTSSETKVKKRGRPSKKSFSSSSSSSSSSDQ